MSERWPEEEARARALDAEDPLSPLRERFHVPPAPGGGEVAYFCGNSLGLMPKAAETVIGEELAAWRTHAVEGHFRAARPWFGYHEELREPLARLVGAEPVEVCAMNGLTVNLHLLMTSFYRPTAERHAIVLEADAFPSDRYAAASQLHLHGFDPDEGLWTLPRREGEATHRDEDIEAFLEERGDRIALLLLGGVSYLTGQRFDLGALSALARRKGIAVGLDLAHAAGNVELRLHDWGADFAAWCSYKYLNAGPGATACAFVHARHAERADLPRLAGWWGNDPETRFRMPERFHPQPGAAGWQLSNCPVLGTAPLVASLGVFDEAGGMAPLVERSRRLTAHLLALLDGVDGVTSITPREPERRGCQLSLRVRGEARAVRDALEGKGIVADLREPDIVRVAPVPLYSRFADLVRLARGLEEVLA